MDQQPLVLGVDIGGTKVALGANCRGDGAAIVQTRYPAESDRGPEHMLAQIVARARALLAPYDRRLAGIGIACGGPLDRRTGTVLGPPNLPGWDRVPVAARLAAALGAPAWLDNDANVAALGESRFGAGRGAASMVYLTVSTGIGGGIVLGGRLVHGVGDAAGEVGHQTVAPGGPRCGCGNDGCLEAVASGTAIARRARAAVAGAPPDAAAALLARAGGDPAGVTAEHVAAAARAGDPLAAGVWDEAMEHLGTGVANVVSVLAPERVVLGGGLAAAGEALLAPVRAVVRRRVRLVPLDAVAVVTAALGQDSGVCGAVALALDQLAAGGATPPWTAT